MVLSQACGVCCDVMWESGARDQVVDTDTDTNTETNASARGNQSANLVMREQEATNLQLQMHISNC